MSTNENENGQVPEKRRVFESSTQGITASSNDIVDEDDLYEGMINPHDQGKGAGGRGAGGIGMMPPMMGMGVGGAGAAGKGAGMPGAGGMAGRGAGTSPAGMVPGGVAGGPSEGGLTVPGGAGIGSGLPKVGGIGGGGLGGGGFGSGLGSGSFGGLGTHAAGSNSLTSKDWTNPTVPNPNFDHSLTSPSWDSTNSSRPYDDLTKHAYPEINDKLPKSGVPGDVSEIKAPNIDKPTMPDMPQGSGVPGGGPGGVPGGGAGDPSIAGGIGGKGEVKDYGTMQSEAKALDQLAQSLDQAVKQMAGQNAQAIDGARTGKPFGLLNEIALPPYRALSQQLLEWGSQGVAELKALSKALEKSAQDYINSDERAHERIKTINQELADGSKGK